VRFESENTDPVVTIGDSHWAKVLNVATVPIFEFGPSCGTCGVLFRRVEEPGARVSDAEAAVMLGDLAEVPRQSVLEKLARLLPSGGYEVGVFSGVPSFVAPGSAEQFWLSHTVKLHGDNGLPDEYAEYAATSYYELGQRYERPGSQWGPKYPRLAAQFLMPLFDPALLDDARVSEWIEHAKDGLPLTALSLAVADDQSPAVEPAGSDHADYRYREHRVLLHFLLDGHHRARAAAVLGAELRVLGFVARQYSWEDSLSETIELFSESSSLGRNTDV